MPECHECCSVWHAPMQVYKEITKDLATGGRAFIVCPLVEASQNLATAHLQVRSDPASPGSALLHTRGSASDPQVAEEKLSEAIRLVKAVPLILLDNACSAFVYASHQQGRKMQL